MSIAQETFEWLTDPSRWSGASGIAARLVEHLGVTALAVGLAAIVAIPLGVAIGHTRRGIGAVAGITGAVRAIPTLGLLTLFGLILGIGLRAPLVALVLLAIPSLLAGAYAGVATVDPQVRDGAIATGLSRAQLIFNVELPLASAVIFGGIRTATLQVVSTATLAAYTADVGLGRFLFTGLKTNDYPLMLASALLVIALALLCEIVLGSVQSYLRRKVAHPAVADNPPSRISAKR